MGQEQAGKDSPVLNAGSSPEELVGRWAGELRSAQYANVKELWEVQPGRYVQLWDIQTRLRWLRHLDRAIRGRKNDILNTLAREKGCSEFNAMLSEYLPARMLLRHYIKTAGKVLADEGRSRPLWKTFGSFANKRVAICKEPLGLVGVISPFNYPFSLPLAPVVAALLGGNAVLLKPAEETPETNRLLFMLLYDSLRQFAADRLFAMLPPQKEYGQALVACPLVDKIHFTGSVAAGWKIAQANAQTRLTPPTLELGGSNAALVLDDADIANAARVIAFARFSGLNCNSIKRVFAVESVYEQLCGWLTRIVSGLEFHERVQKFPAREEESFRRFMQDYVTRTGLKGYSGNTAPVICRIQEYRPDLAILQEETFCPILPVVKVKDEAEAVRCANDSRFGLGATVFTRDKARFARIAAQLDAGGVYHNDGLAEFAQPQVPFGGIKESGWGLTHGPEGLLDFVRPKPVITETRWAPKLQLYPWTKSKQKWLRRFIELVIRLS